MAGGNPDVKLLFGAHEESFGQINNDLVEIINKINQKPLGVKLGVYKKVETAWASDIKAILGKVNNNKNNDFSVKIPHIKISPSAIAEFKQQLSAVINAVNLDKGVSVTVSEAKAGDVGATHAAPGVSPDGTTQNIGAIQATTKEYNELAAAAERAKVAEEPNPATIEHINSKASAVHNLSTALKESSGAAEKNEQDVITSQLKRLNSIQSLVKKHLKNWSAAKHGSTSDAYKNLETADATIEKFIQDIVLANKPLGNFDKEIGGITKTVTESSAVIKAAGKDVRSFGDKAKTAAEKFSTWFSVSQVVMRLFNAMKQMVSVVIEIDTAMTELRKVTNETETAYVSFLENATIRAKNLGATISDVVSASADFARLGYNLNDAAQLADAAIVYKNVGDGIEDIGTASESIISTMQAFGIEASNAMLIVDKFNKVGNEFAISSKGVGDALVRSAAAMHSAGNTIDETIALAAAANTVVQNPDSVGTTMKTVSMYLRAAKTEAEEAGESVDGMAGSVSELRKEILALTGNEVDIMLDEKNFKSTYQILKELSDTWDRLSDVSRANILEMVGGKRNANVVAALLENFDTAEDVLASAGDAAGSATAENLKYLDSIQGHIATFKAEFQELSTILIDSDIVKQIVDLGSLLLNILDILAKIVDLAGGLGGTLFMTGSAAIVMNIGKIYDKLTHLFGVFGKLGKATALYNSLVTGYSASATTAAVSTGALSTATTALGIRLQSASHAAKLLGISLSSAQIAIAAVTAGIMLLVTAVNAVKRARDEARQKTEEIAQAAAEENKTLRELIKRYGELEDTAKSDIEFREEAKQIQEQITDLVGKQADGIDLVNGRLETQKKKLGEIEKAFSENTYGALVSKYDDASAQFDFGIRARDAGGFLGVVDNASNINKVLSASGFNDPDFFRSYGKDGLGRIDITKALSGKDASEVLETLKAVQEHLLWYYDSGTLRSMSYADRTMVNNVKTDIQTKIDLYSSIVSELEAAERNLATEDLAKYTREHDIETVDQYNELIRKIENGEGDFADTSESFKKALIELAKERFPEFSGAAKDAADAVGDISSAMSAGSMLSNATPVHEEIVKLSEALNEFKENGKLSPDELSKLTETFGKLPSFDSAITTLSNTSTTASEANDALSQLAKEFLTVGAGADVLESMLSGVTEETADFTKSLLEQMGVANAQELVMDHLAAQMLETKFAGEDITKITEDAAAKFLEESGAAGSAAAALKLLREESLRAKIASTDLKKATSEEIGVLIAYAKSLNLSTANLEAYRVVKELIDSGMSGVGGLTASEIDQMLQDAQQSLDDFISGSSNIEIKLPKVTGGSSVEEYTADIEEFREALERLEQIRLNKELLELDLSHTDDLKEQIRLERDLANVYEHEAQVIKELIALRTASIQDKIKTLEGRGFNVEYDPEKHRLLVTNLEHLNELTKGGTKTTNEYRKETEELIKTIEELNADNQEGTTTWKELEYSIRESKDKIIEHLKSIVAETSEAIDSIQSVYDTLKEAADDFAANGGYISVDAYQKIVELGPQYMSYLRDENGLLVINKDRINDVIAAKTEQLALESAMTYVERLRMALDDGKIEQLEELLGLTKEVTNATWGLVYANLEMLNLAPDQHAAALHNINAMRAMAENAIQGIYNMSENYLDELNDMKSGLDDILQYVMDMLRDDIERQIDALEEEKESYAELIDLKKESLEETEKETDYQEEVADKIKEIAKLQERINALSLDDSREAQAQKIALEEEMAELQKELADTQSDYANEAQQESLDKMQEAYEEEKDKEIEILEDSISSEQKLYEKAIDYIESNWDTLYQDLINWNYEYGSVLNDEIASAWDNCLAAAQRYGSYVNALKNIDADIESASGSSGNLTLGNTNYDSSYSDEDAIHAIIKQMYENMNEHGGSGSSTSPERKAYLSSWNLELGADLKKYGINAYRDETGTWWTDPSKTEKLFEAYSHYTYHTGGIAGNRPTLKQKELFARLEEGEAVFNDKQQERLFEIIKFSTAMTDKIKQAFGGMSFSSLFQNMKINKDTPNSIMNNQTKSIHFGDVYVYGGNEKTVEAHREVNRQFANEILKQLNIKR